MLSKKQTDILHWPYTGRTALICDGAVRSGKTSIMSLSFILWAMRNFNNCNFGRRKTVGSLEAISFSRCWVSPTCSRISAWFIPDRRIS